MNSIQAYLFKYKHQVREVDWFRKALYLFLLYKVIVYAFHFDILFSAHGFIYRINYHFHSLNDLAFLLSSIRNTLLDGACIISLGFCSLLGLMRRSTYVSNAILWLLLININNYLYPTLTAGDYLLNQLLFFNIFLSRSPGKTPVLNDLKTAAHNLGLSGMKIQVCLVYVVATWFKLTDNAWLQGTALFHIFQIEEYSNSVLAALPEGLCRVLTYMTLAYQLLFSVLIGVRPLKIYLLGFGVLQHLVIAFGMGLLSFGSIMIICYILFLKYDGKGPVVSKAS